MTCWRLHAVVTLRQLVLVWAGCLLSGMPVLADTAIRLSEQCPPSFVLEKGICKLHTPYQQYGSLRDAGVGGLKTGLPEFRGGFKPKEMDLGRYLFFDPLLSKDGSMSCASCHNPDHGFAEAKARSQGIANRDNSRNAPSLWNSGFLKRFFWDGRASSLEDQMEGPLYNDHEMGTTREHLLKAINSAPQYRSLFADVYDDAKTGVTLQHIYRAIAAFESSLISLNSRYDLYAHGYSDALNARELQGLNVFRSFVARCAECHTPPMFTNQQIAVLGTPDPAGLPFDIGAQKNTGEPTLRGGFKVPSLRNVALTAPYMHSGRFNSLRETVSFYTKGRGHAVPAGEKLTLHWHIWEPKLSDQELDRLVDFLGTLTDESFKPEPPKSLPSGLSLHLKKR